MASPLDRLVDELSRLPGIGRKTATRLAFHVLRAPEEEARALARAIDEVRAKLSICSVCCYLTDEDPCASAATRAAIRARSAWSRSRRT